MGEARRRGTREQRETDAIKRDKRALARSGRTQSERHLSW